MGKDFQWLEAKETVIDHLATIQAALVRCVDEGMIDADSTHYNQILDLMDDALIVEGWDELQEIIALAKTLEVDIAGWLSLHGKTSISLPWPHKPI